MRQHGIVVLYFYHLFTVAEKNGFNTCIKATVAVKNGVYTCINATLESVISGAYNVN